jgi:hypothetical protein
MLLGVRSPPPSLTVSVTLLGFCNLENPTGVVSMAPEDMTYPHFISMEHIYAVSRFSVFEYLKYKDIFFLLLESNKLRCWKLEFTT